MNDYEDGFRDQSRDRIVGDASGDELRSMEEPGLTLGSLEEVLGQVHASFLGRPPSDEREDRHDFSIRRARSVRLTEKNGPVGLGHA